jgi:hypothetical protein
MADLQLCFLNKFILILKLIFVIHFRNTINPRETIIVNRFLPHSVPKGPKSGRASLKTRKGRASLKTRKGRASLKTRKGHASLKTRKGRASLKPVRVMPLQKPVRDLSEASLNLKRAEKLPHSVPKGPKSGRASLKTRKGRASLKTRKGRASLKTRKGRASLKTREGLVQGKVFSGKFITVTRTREEQ